MQKKEKVGTFKQIFPEQLVVENWGMKLQQIIG